MPGEITETAKLTERTDVYRRTIRPITKPDNLTKNEECRRQQCQERLKGCQRQQS